MREISKKLGTLIFWENAATYSDIFWNQKNRPFRKDNHYLRLCNKYNFLGRWPLRKEHLVNHQSPFCVCEASKTILGLECNVSQRKKVSLSLSKHTHTHTHMRFLFSKSWCRFRKKTQFCPLKQLAFLKFLKIFSWLFKPPKNNLFIANICCVIILRHFKCCMKTRNKDLTGGIFGGFSYVTAF